MRSRRVQLGAGRKPGETRACGEKTGEEREVMRAVSLMVLNAESNLGEEGAVWKGALRHLWK